MREPGLHLHGHVTSSGTVSAPQLFASNTLTVTNTSDFSDDLFLTKNWAGWSKLQVSNNSAAPDSGPELRLLGNQSAKGLPGAGRRGAPVRAHHDQRRGAGADEEPLHAAVPDHEPEEPRLPRDRRQHGQRGLQHELHEFVGQPGVAELQQLFDSVEAKQYKRPDMNEDLRLGFASNDFAGTKWKNLTGNVRWSDGTEMVTLDYSHLTSVLWGVCKGFQARLESSGPAEAAPVMVSVAPVSAPVAAKLAAVAAPKAVSVPMDTSPTVVKFPALAVLLMVSVRSFKHVYICSCRRLSPVAPAPRLRSWSEAGSAALVLEWHSGRSEKFPCPRDSGVVCLTHRPLTGVTACWCVKHTNPSSAQVSASTSSPGGGLGEDWIFFPGKNSAGLAWVARLTHHP